MRVNGDSGPALSVVVAATDHRPTLPRCLLAIDAARGAGDELIVVDDPALAGAASARNHGAVAASHAVLVFVDADVEVCLDALERIRTRFANDPTLAGLFGSYDDEPEERDVVSTFRNLLHHHVHTGAGGDSNSFWAGLGAVRRTTFAQLGGFDTRCTWVEDVEFGARLGATGRIELDPRIQGKHLKRWTFPDMVMTDLTRRGIPWTRLAVRGRATHSELNLAWRHRISTASSVALVVSLARRQPAAAGGALAVLCVINRHLYRLLADRGGRHLLGGIGLHVVHHLTSVVALVVGVLGMRGAAGGAPASPATGDR